MPKISFPFIGETYQSRSKLIAADECCNMYPEIEKTGKSVVALIGRPGLKYLATYSGIGGNRGMYTSAGDKAFYIIGNKLLEFTSEGTVIDRGTLSTVNGQCSMADNGVQLIVVDGVYGYILTLSSNKFERITSDEFPGNVYPTGGVSHVVFIDGYFIVNKNNTSQNNLWVSAQYDGLTWDASDYFSAEASPDGVTAIAECNNELCAFGNKSLQIFYNAGDPGQLTPLRVAGGHLNIGCIAPASVDSSGQALYWLGANEEGHGIVWRTAGYQPTRISNHAIEYQIGEMIKIEDAIGFCYQQEGHAFYVLTFPTGQKTFVYDITTNMWHTRTSGSYGFWLGQNHCFMGTKNYCGDFTNGNIYEIDFDTYTDNSLVFDKIRTCQHIHQDRKRLFFSSFEIDMERGVGLTNDTGATDTSSDPQAALCWSDDGGFTWSNWYSASIGKKGDYLARVKWNRLGCSRDRLFSVKIVAPIKTVMLGAVMETSVEVD
jgi:hypothetical protein